MNLAPLMDLLLDWLGRASWQASVLIGLVLLVQALLRSKLTPQWRSALWWLVLIRLVMPVVPQTPWSLFNYTRLDRMGAVTAPLVSRAIGRRAQDAMDTAFTRPSASAPAEQEKEAMTSTSEPGAAASINSAPADTPQRYGQPWAWRQTLAALWLAGVAAFLVRVAWAYGVFARRLRHCSAIDDPTVLSLFDECRQLMGAGKPAALIATPEVDSPALFGFWRVRLLLPDRLTVEFSREELRYVLLHELAHLRRGDVRLNWLMTLLQALHWFNPVLWFGFARMRADRELACDALALAAAPAEAKRPYGRTIIRLLERFARPSPVPGLVGIVEDRKQMENRIRMIAKFTKPTRGSALSALLVIGLGAVALTDAQTEEGEAKPPTTPADADAVVDPTTGLKFVVSKMIAGTNDVINYDGGIRVSPNEKFLLWWGRVVPLDGSPTFKVKELKGAGIAAWSPDGQRIAFNSGGIRVLPVSPDTGRPTGAPRMLFEEKSDWFRGKIYWSPDSEQVLYVKWNGRMEREVGSINLRDGRLNKQPNYADFGLVSPDGKITAYSIPQDGIWAKPTEEGAGRIVRPRSGGWLFDDVAVWTSDSQWVVSAVSGWRREEIHFARVSDGQGFDVFPPAAVGAFVGKSKDGKKLHFFHSSFDPQNSFKVVPVSGESAHDVGLSDPSDYPWDHSWTADSASLAVLAMGNGRAQLWSVPVAGGGRVEFNLDLIGTNRLGIWSLSPGCRRVLYQESSSTNRVARKANLYIAPISLKESRATGPGRLVFEGWQNPNPTVAEQVGAWSPDGAQVAMPHQGDQGHEIWILSADGSKPKRIIQTPDKVGSRPQWSPDGRMIAFHLTAPDREMLQVISVEGGIVRTILTTPQGQAIPFAWSPGSQEIVAVLDGTLTGFLISGGSGRVVANLREKSYETPSWLRWSPDGKRLAFHSGSRLHLLSPATGEIADLNTPLSSAWSFAWSPDSKMISCISEESKKVRPAGVIRELDVAEAVQKAPPLAERKPTIATNAPPAEPVAGPVFTDDFDNGPSKHWRFQDFPDQGLGPGRHAVENGELMLSHARASLEGFDWANYIVTVRVCVKEWAASGLASLAIETRATPSAFGSGRMDRYCLGIFRNNNDPSYLWLGMNYADGSDVLRHGQMSRSPCSVVVDKWYTLEFEVRGQYLRGYLDGKLMVEATDTRLTKGRIWFGATAGRTLFDDFSVRQLP